VRTIRIALVLALVALAACGGEDAGTTTVADAGDDEATSTSAAAEATTTTADDEDDGQVVGIDDIPQECMDLFVSFLRDIEPLVEPVDWANATTEDLEELGTALEPLTEEYDASVAGTGCDDLELDATDEESFEFMIDMAEREAPGAVAYFEWIRDFTSGMSDAPQASGDCETDIAAMQAIVDQGQTMNQLPMAELTAVGSLMTAIAMECPPERSAEFFEKEDVAAFTSGGG